MTYNNTVVCCCLCTVLSSWSLGPHAKKTQPQPARDMLGCTHFEQLLPPCQPGANSVKSAAVIDQARRTYGSPSESGVVP